MKLNLFLSFLFSLFFLTNYAQNNNFPQDFLTKEFHKDRREKLRSLLPKNSVAVFFANAVRNRSNTVEYKYHQNPNFYYLTGYKEPHALVLIFKEEQLINNQKVTEVIFVQENNAFAEMWNGKRLGIKGTKEQLGFKIVYNGSAFKNYAIDFSKFDTILFQKFENDVRNTEETADLYNLMEAFKEKITSKTKEKTNSELLQYFMASLREIKTKEELVLLKKAIQISVIGQLEVMKAIHPNMSETEVQGIHEFVYRKYGVAQQGYPSIVASGNNGCTLHYTKNNKSKIGNNKLVLMDLGAEYHGYTADITRTIPANGTFTTEQKQIYNLVYKAQKAGIASAIIGNSFNTPNIVTKKIINKGLAELGIIATENTNHTYFPHGATHHIGLDVHDLTNYGAFKENMVLTIEPGIYIPEGSPCDKKWWGIAIRIEDNILISKKGPINLSAMLPKKAAEIEAVMKLLSVLNNFNLPKLE